MNIEYINNVKASSNIRILSLNPNSINPNNEEKINMLIQSCQNKKIDVLLLSKMNVKWTASNIEKMKIKLLTINKNAQISTADSKDHDLTENDWLLGGTITAFTGNIVSIFDSTLTLKDLLGKWIINILTNEQLKF